MPTTAPYKQIDKNPNSLFSNTPQVYSRYGNTKAGMTIPTDDICSLYVENWGAYPGVDKLPNGFIVGNPQLRSLLVPSNSSVISINNPYIRFLISGVQSAYQETSMIQKNFTQGFTSYVFGQEPPLITFSGTLVHTYWDNWSELFLSLYENFLRASKLAELSILNKIKYQVVLRYQGKVMKGSLMNFSKSSNSMMESAVQFSFGFLLKHLSFKWSPSPDVTDYPLMLEPASETKTKYNENGSVKKINSTPTPVLNNTNTVSDNGVFS